MSDRWRDTYDEWKTREPDDDVAYVCDACGGWLRWSHSDGWYCEACDERDAVAMRRHNDPCPADAH